MCHYLVCMCVCVKRECVCVLVCQVRERVCVWLECSLFISYLDCPISLHHYHCWFTVCVGVLSSSFVF